MESSDRVSSAGLGAGSGVAVVIVDVETSRLDDREMVAADAWVTANI